MTRIEREFKTIQAMILLYCKEHHSPTQEICQHCQELLRYSQNRLTKCPFQEVKPTCGNCTVHCYSKQMQKITKDVMRFSGPRMIWHHPLMALAHFLDSFRKAPKVNKKNSQSTTSPH